MRTRKAKDRSRLIQAAMGQIPCDLTIGNVQFFNVITGEIYPASVDILDGFVVLVREEGQEAVLPSKSYYDGHGRYLIPGYIDTHMHIESTMMIPENLARAILPWGTTTICTDPHEIGNVMGLDGVRFMLANAKKSRLRQYVLAPSCVPSLPGMENAGAEFLAKEVGELLDMDDVIGIAEIMDYVGVIQDSERMHTIIDEGLRRGMFLQGHAPYCFGRELAAYRIGGPVSDHESVNADEVRAPAALVRLSSAPVCTSTCAPAPSLITFPSSLTAARISRGVISCPSARTTSTPRICSPSAISTTLCARRSPPASTAVKLSRWRRSTLRVYGFDDLGAIAPGYIADIQLVDALDGSRPKAVFTEGVLVAEDGKYLGGDCKTADYDLPNTVDLPQITGPASFELRVPEGYTGDTIRVNVMVSEDGNRILRHVEPVELPVRDGVVDISGDPTLVFVCCANRYGRGGKTIAVYRDFGLRSGALASTISHDSHNFTVSYHDPKDAFRAAEILRACGGGICVIDGEQETHIALPAAGLMSQKPCAEVADEIAAVQSALDVISDGQLTLLATAIMALPVLPSVVITDMGLVNGANQTFVPVFADAEA